ncbi:molybdate ABC transporter substrate-binding protein [Candidatus Nitrospira inopinata]|jgi:molybdate transport system substrate-binding protein|uniref:Molybdate ABC transporter, periplasmic binding protein n=1 Tax=Candidatus Nitrospira inopinata TaxID=1715989 RepID=A0A0S4KUR7_9BACT|nr:molybdate ABC transporter substrate-binding protein [Candidatus Nitrospira inopinata]CUQ68156.1 Molybdate ABC transporter, periplasmic binding protein [Candidatus Nitrospira inopinata]
MWHVPQNKQSRSCVLWIACAVLVVTVFAGSCQALATEILVAAAADLNFAIKDIIAEFEQKTGHRVKLSLGSSGNFYSQISNGAPFEIFFSADIDFPRKLEEAHLTVPNTIFPYAVGRLVVWVTKESPIDVEKAGIDALLDPSVKKIAIANPRHAPYGRAAVAAMKHFGLHDKVESKFVLGENIAQTAQFIQSGNADIGIIALSLAMAPSLREVGRFWEIPLTAYPRMEQGAVILETAKKNGSFDAVKQFADWVSTPAGRAVLKRYGFYMPEEAHTHGK